MHETRNFEMSYNLSLPPSECTGYLINALQAEMLRRQTAEDDVIGLKKEIDSICKRLDGDNVIENPKASRSIFLILAIMATGKYGFDPDRGKNETAGIIKKAAKDYGMAIDEDTINKWIRHACSYSDLPNKNKILRIPANSASIPLRKRPPFRFDSGRCSGGKAASC